MAGKSICWKIRDTGEKCGMEFVAETVNTHCVTLDVETADGQEIFTKMASNVDMLIDGMPPGYMDNLGIGYRQLKEANPKMIYVWVGVLTANGAPGRTSSPSSASGN